MTEYDLFVALRAALVAQAARFPNGTTFVRANAPVVQGRPSGPSVLFFPVGSRRYGWLRRDEVWDADAGRYVHREVQAYETTVQFEALGPPPVAGVSTPTVTAADLVNTAAAVLQSDKALASLRAAGLGVLRVTDVRQPYMQNDRDQFEAVPSFDLIVTREQIVLDSTEAAYVGELRMARV